MSSDARHVMLFALTSDHAINYYDELPAYSFTAARTMSYLQRAMQDNPPHAVIIDSPLSDDSRLDDAVAWLAEHAPALPVIVVLAAPEEAARWRESHVRAVFTRPLAVDALRGAVADALAG